MAKEPISDLTADQVRSLLDYNPETGIFAWKVGRRCARKGDQAGCKGRTDISIRLMYRIYKAHRLAWLYMTGEWPDRLIDHKDGDPFNNKWSNLRLATYSENARNRKADKDNKSGLKGVRRQKKKWASAIFVDGKQIHLGTFESAEDAHQAYICAAQRHYGDFAKWN